MKQHFQVNWINGMKVGSSHFIELENHFINRTQLLTKGSITPVSYGILPSDDKEKSIQRYTLHWNEEKIGFNRDLLALTPDGFLVQIPANSSFNIFKPADGASQYYLVLTVDPYIRMPYGEINEQEIPVRYPFALPDYKFQFLPVTDNVSNVLGNTILPIAKYSGSTLEEDPNFIPPSASIQSHPELTRYYNEVVDVLLKLEKTTQNLLCARVIAHKPLLLNLLEFYSQNKPSLLWYVPYQSPVFLFEKIVQVAGILYNYNEYELKTTKEDEMKTILSKILSLKYNHLDIAMAIRICRTFSDSYTRFLKESSTIPV